MSSLKVSEVFCYICRGILIEPVTLPCSHVFCLSCFEQSMQETSHTCPFCRKRVSNWIRSVRKSNTLINEKLWEKIKKQFKEQVRLKLNGEDDGLDHYINKESPVIVSTSKPGEIAQEFSELLKKFNYEKEKIEEAEELASKKLIEKLAEEEEENIKILKKTNLLKIKEDEKLAVLMQKELNKEYVNLNSSARKNSLRKKKKTFTGPMDNFVKEKTNIDKLKSQKSFSHSEESDTEVLLSRSTSTDSTDSLRLEMNLFKPIKKALTTPPKRYPDGKIKEINLTKVIPLKLSLTDSTFSDRILVEGKNIHSRHSAFVDTNYNLNSEEHFESPSKRLKLSTDKPDNKALKNIDKENNKTSQNDITEVVIKKKAHKKNLRFKAKSSCSYLKHDYTNLKNETCPNTNPIIDEQRRIEQIILQEKTDRQLALKLSKEWESEEKNRPQTRAMLAKSLKKNKNKLNNNKIQQTLIESISKKRRKTK